VDNPHAPVLPMQRLGQKVPQRLLSLHDRQPMQINLRLHPILPAAKLPQNGHLHSSAVVNELIARRQFRITRFPIETLKQHSMPIRTAEARDRRGSPPAGNDRSRLTARQPFDILYRFSEQPKIIFVVGCGYHATSAEIGSSIVAASLALTQPPQTPP
jgi:hypothetical protein